MTPIETLNTLCQEHFPDCKTPEQQEPLIAIRKQKADVVTFDISDERADVITMEKLKKAISDNGNIRGPGSDEIPPIVYKKMGPKALNRLLTIYKASYLLSLHPDVWLDVKVIFFSHLCCLIA